MTTNPASSSFVPIARTVRSGFEESCHFGIVVALAEDGSVAFHAGDPRAVIYPRSSNKPMQATAMVEAGLSIAPDLLALVSASHDGTPMHLDAARRILAGVGLDEDSLQNTRDYPINEASTHENIRNGGGRTSLQQNCSGKHAGMIATSVVNGWDALDYRSPDHPVQVAITRRMAELTGCVVEHIGVDGCGAPAHAYSLVGLARAMRRIAIGGAGPAGASVYAAMTANPEMVGGPHRDVTRFMQLVPGLVAKDGAEGVFAAALPDGRAVALKVADGANRARPPLMLAALAELGVDVSAVSGVVRQRVLGHGREVGEVDVIAEFVRG